MQAILSCNPFNPAESCVPNSLTAVVGLAVTFQLLPVGLPPSDMIVDGVLNVVATSNAAVQIFANTSMSQIWSVNPSNPSTIISLPFAQTGTPPPGTSVKLTVSFTPADSSPNDAAVIMNQVTVSTLRPQNQSCPGYQWGAAAPPHCTPGGQACDDTTLFTPCLNGYFCPDGCQIAGLPCPAVNVCVNKASTPGVCPAGYYCSPSSQTECASAATPNAPYCPLGTMAAAAPLCPAGYYCDTAATSTQCVAGDLCVMGSKGAVNCPAGSECNTTQVATHCHPRYYCPPRTTQAQLCRAKYFCNTTASEYLCAAGSYCPVGSTSEQPCELGSACPQTDVQTPCNLTDFCPAGTVTPQLCALGHFCPNASAQLTCPSGSYCLNGTVDPRPCPAGHWCPNPSTLHTCTPPSYCPAGQTAPLDCPAGSSCPDPSVADVCPQGTYCPVNSTRPRDCELGFVCETPKTQLSCNLTYFCPVNTSLAQFCPNGTFCPNASISIVCDMGRYCPQGSVQQHNCTRGMRCPTPSEMIECDPSDYCPLNSQNASVCASGSYCTTPATEELCTLGHYCPPGTVLPILCNPGNYCINGSSTPHECPPGSYCPDSSTIRPCEPGYACAAGSIFETRCTPSNYCPSHSAAPLPCDRGNYCPDGVHELPCDPGDFCPAKSANRSLCPAGSYCPIPAERIDCVPGQYCLGGALNYSVCTLGHYCPDGTSQLPCVPGTYCDVGAPSMQPCPPGSYCPDGMSLHACQLGDWCPLGSPMWINCPAGNYCVNASVIASCGPGEVCTARSTSPRPCSLGHYCPSSVSQQPCPNGTFMDQVGSKSQQDCKKCPVGTASATVAATSKSYCLGCRIGTQGLSEGLSACTPCPHASYADAPGLCVPCASAGCLGSQECSPGYDGDSCSLCTPGYYLDTIDSTSYACRVCTTTSGWVVGGIVILVLLAAVAFVKLNSRKRWRQMLIPLRIGWQYVQIIALLRLMQVAWPTSVRQTLNFASITIFNLQVSEISCFITFGLNFTATMAFPFFIAAAFLLAYLAFRLVFNNQHRLPRCVVNMFPNMRDRDGRGHARFRFLLYRSYVSFLVVSYLTLAWQSLVVMDCVEDIADTATYRVRDFAGLTCYSSEWFTYFWPSALGLVFYALGIPVLLLWLLASRNSEAFLGSTVTGFRAEYRWWSVGTIIWRFVLVMVLRLLLDETLLQILLASGLIVAKLIAQVIYQPYLSALHNRQDSALSVMAVIIICIGGIFYRSAEGMDLNMQRALFVMVLVFVAAMFFYTMYSAWKTWSVFVEIRSGPDRWHGRRRRDRVRGELLPEPLLLSADEVAKDRDILGSYGGYEPPSPILTNLSGSYTDHGSELSVFSVHSSVSSHPHLQHTQTHPHHGHHPSQDESDDVELVHAFVANAYAKQSQTRDKQDGDGDGNDDDEAEEFAQPVSMHPADDDDNEAKN